MTALLARPENRPILIAAGFVLVILALGTAYTLNSIAAVVLGGTSLLGGIGGAIASLVGALILRVISFYFRILSVDPLLQPLVEGVVLLLAVSLGAVRALRVKNRLELFR